MLPGALEVRMTRAGYAALSHQLAQMAAPLDRPLDEGGLEEARELVRWAQLALATGPTWAPITTAPQDGAPILGYVQFARGGQVMQVSWNKGLGEWTASTPSRVVRPTHWMPLPKPPAREAA